jgi:hypothetical protein
MGSLACVFSVLRVSGQLVGRILNGVTKYGQRTNIFTDRQKKVAPQTPLRPGLGLQPSDSVLNASRDRGQYDCYITVIEIGYLIGN